VRFDLVLDNANIFTVDPALRRAGSIGIIGDRIVAVAQRGELARFDTGRTIDLDGHFVAPGFNDAHNHMQMYGASLNEVPLNGDAVHSIEELVAAIADRASSTPAGAWIVGSGYDHNKLAERRHPTCHELDRVSPDHPVLLNHTSGHFATLNSPAMRLARIGEVDVPDGGVVAVDDEGRPNGLLEEQAQQLVRSLVHPRSVAEMATNLGLASDRYLSEAKKPASAAFSARLNRSKLLPTSRPDEQTVCGCASR
jgi:predicted amidohydrolase YtcJ